MLWSRMTEMRAAWGHSDGFTTDASRLTTAAVDRIAVTAALPTAYGSSGGAVSLLTAVAAGVELVMFGAALVVVLVRGGFFVVFASGDVVKRDDGVGGWSASVSSSVSDGIIDVVGSAVGTSVAVD